MTFSFPSATESEAATASLRWQKRVDHEWMDFAFNTNGTDQINLVVRFCFIRVIDIHSYRSNRVE
jgi:hypothetical protein